MADDSEKWLQRKKLYQQSSKDRWPCGDTDSPGSPDRSGRREGDEESHKPSSAELLKRGSEGGAAREGRPSQAWSPSPGRGRAVLSCVWVLPLIPKLFVVPRLCSLCKHITMAAN